MKVLFAIYDSYSFNLNYSMYSRENTLILLNTNTINRDLYVTKFLQFAFFLIKVFPKWNIMNKRTLPDQQLWF